MSAIDDIAAERQRQIDIEGWNIKHDDEHDDKSLAMAAALYASPRDDLVVIELKPHGVKWIDPWPWYDVVDVAERGDCPIYGKRSAWDKRKKHDRRRRLVIAGALILAEIERIDRAQTES
jgi:hypothetical protein